MPQDARRGASALADALTVAASLRWEEVWRRHWEVALPPAVGADRRSSSLVPQARPLRALPAVVTSVVSSLTFAHLSSDL